MDEHCSPQNLRNSIFSKSTKFAATPDLLFVKKPLALLPLGAMLCGMALVPTVAAQGSGSEAVLAPVNVKDSTPNHDYSPAASSVGSKGESAALRDIPQTVNVTNRAVIESQGATSLKEALRNVPGITISAGEGGAIGDAINLRGFNARTDMYIDGFRDRGQYTRDTFYLESVEVLKGSSSMLFGRGSTGGVINQNSKKPDLNARGEVTVSAGTHDFYRTTLDINQPLSETAAFRVAAFGQDAQNTRDVIHNQDFGFAPSVRLGIGSATEVLFSALIQRNNDIPDYGVPLIRSDRTAGAISKPLDVTSENFYGYVDDHFDQEVNSLNATIKHKFNDRVTLINRTQYVQYRTEAAPSPLSAAVVVGATSGTGAAIPVRGLPLEQLQAARQNRDRSIRDETISNSTDLTLKFGSGDIRHTLLTGVEFDFDQYENDSYDWSTTPAQRFINLGNPQNGSRAGLREKFSNNEVTAKTIAVYVNDRIEFGNQWQLVGGVRWDRFDAEADQVVYPLSFTRSLGATAPYSVDQAVDIFSIRAGVIWQPVETQSYYISYGTSANPSAEGLTLSVAQADTDPEESRAVEIGAKFDLLDGHLQLTSALFQIEKTDARTTVNNVVTLDGDQRVRGVELSAVGHLTPAWQVLAGYTYMDSEMVKSADTTTVAVAGATLAAPTTNVTLFAEGNTLQNTPRDTASLWTTYNVTDNWEIGGGAVYSSKRHVNNFETAVIDGYTSLNATVAYRQKEFGVRLNLQNLTDEVYYETASGGRATPAAGRTAIVTTSLWF